MTLRKNGTKDKPTEEDREALQTTASVRDKLADEGLEDNATARNHDDDED